MGREIVSLIGFLVIVQTMAALGSRLIDRRKNAARLMIALSVYGLTVGLVAFLLGRSGITLRNLGIGTVVIVIALLLVWRILSNAISLPEETVE